MVIFTIKNMIKMVFRIILKILLKVNLINMIHYKFATVDTCVHMAASAQLITTKTKNLRNLNNKNAVSKIWNILKSKIVLFVGYLMIPKTFEALINFICI